MGFDVMERWFWGSQDEVEGQKAKSMNWVGETEQRDLALSWDFSCSFPGQKAAAPRSPGGKNLCGFTESLNMGRTSQMRGDRVNCWNQAGLELCCQHRGCSVISGTEGSWSAWKLLPAHGVCRGNIPNSHSVSCWWLFLGILTWGSSAQLYVGQQETKGRAKAKTSKERIKPVHLHLAVSSAPKPGRS